jgi:hypothetical protein
MTLDTASTSVADFAQDQLDLIMVRVTALGVERASLVELKTFWDGIGGQQGAQMAARAVSGIARVDEELAQLAIKEELYTDALTTGVFSLGRVGFDGQWRK